MPPTFDIISILAHSDRMNRMSIRERMGILILFLVGGNDTTRNSMSGGLWGLSQFPDELAKLRRNPELIAGRGAGDHPLADAGDPHAAHRP